jgi:glucan biosynthesis protein C
MPASAPGPRRVADRSPRKPGRRSSLPGRRTRSCCPFYVLHEPVAVAAVWAIVRWHAPILGEYVSLVIAPFGGTLAPYEVLVRRFRVTRFLFGMKPAPRLTDLEGHTR